MINQDPRFSTAEHTYWLIMALLCILTSFALLTRIYFLAAVAVSLMALITALLLVLHHHTRRAPIQEKKLQFFYKMKNQCVFSDGYTGREEIAKSKHLQVNRAYVCDTVGHKVLSIKWPAPTDEELAEKEYML